LGAVCRKRCTQSSGNGGGDNYAEHDHENSFI
jgi:hypothetical protein